MGYLGETYGWRYGFGLAGIGMVIGLVTFLRGQKYLHGLAEPGDSARLLRRTFRASAWSTRFTSAVCWV
ncbi:MAG: hypothetical protein R3E50_00275 [Halioglobus sp.]